MNHENNYNLPFAEILTNLSKRDMEQINALLSMINDPKNLEEFISGFKENAVHSRIGASFYFEIIRLINRPELFTVIVDGAYENNTEEYIVDAFRSIKTVPKDIQVVVEYLPKIIEMMEKNRYPSVLYSGIVLLQRILQVHPKADRVLRERPLTLDKSSMELLKKGIADIKKAEGKSGKQAIKTSRAESSEEVSAFMKKYIKLLEA